MQHFSTYKIIEKKRDRIPLSSEEINWFIHGLTDGEVADYQMTALLMAIFINGMNEKETAALTKAMLLSGKTLSFNDRTVIDKHSTGGVGDKSSFIVGPLAAACGVKVPMVAGRGLGHTGGTIDKVEAIKNFRTNIHLDEFKDLLNKHNLVLTGQTSEIAPADKKIYALRDVTATINSIPLITASILSKKLAEGISGYVMDLKFGSGSFMKTVSGCEKLGNSMMNVSRSFGVNSMMFITNMDFPLGNMAGHSLELIECIDVLKGSGPNDLRDLSISLAGGMIFLADLAATHDEGIQIAAQALDNGSALEKFYEMIASQGGELSPSQDPRETLPLASEVFDIKSNQDGYIQSFDNEAIGFSLVNLGGGRKVKTDKIDFGVGLEFLKKPGDEIKSGETILKVYHNKSQLHLVEELRDKYLNNIINFNKTRPEIDPLIYKVIIDKE